MRHWFTLCLEGHSTCRQTISRIRVYDPDQTPLPSRVLQVGTKEAPKLQLITALGHRASYAALSYCWGSDEEVEPLKTTKASVGQFSVHIDEADVPLTIRQAIFVTRLLGLEYLWVDSLCIVQNDEDDDWNSESQKIGSIYQNATVTIAATSAQHCNAALFRRRKVDFNTGDTIHASRRTVRIPCGKDGVRQGDMHMSLMSEDDWASLDFDTEISQSKWSSRA
ncbi:HET-domain-containing protein [Setomelanomma holmii]|uniref:HET-domain-containing protein n=1 Tax=Setomelanomma holmii TaxID=210430 RepID=A0A9P4H5D6_9PLEO|nr:HET-domain-containing protein [Setomelanomma holmii]